MPLSVINELDYLCLGTCEVAGLNRFVASHEFDSWIEEQLAAARTEVLTPEWESRREAVRGLLRRGGFKPSGRSKPAQEYLLRCLYDGNFPRINPAVDCLNAISVRIGLPISMLDKSRFPDALRVRVGRREENYVFNSVGQELDLNGLITVCGGLEAAEPLGSPVKDSMAGKITVVEVEKIVENGALEPENIHLPGIYVHRIVINATPEKRIEQRTVRAAS